MTDVLHYPGDLTVFDPDHVMGPDLYGAFYRATAAAYDAETNHTALTLTVVPPDELRWRREMKLNDHVEDEAVRLRIETLFGTVVGS